MKKKRKDKAAARGSDSGTMLVHASVATVVDGNMVAVAAAPQGKTKRTEH